MSDSKPPFQFLATSSKISLESYELARMNAAANLRRQLLDVADQWIEAEVESRLARWVLEHRRRDPKERFEEIVAIEAASTGAQPLPAPPRRAREKPALTSATVRVRRPRLPARHPVTALATVAQLATSAGRNVAPVAAVSHRPSRFRDRHCIRRTARRF
jgi:hypothetical protein